MDGGNTFLPGGSGLDPAPFVQAPVYEGTGYTEEQSRDFYNNNETSPLAEGLCLKLKLHEIKVYLFSSLKITTKFTQKIID